MEISERKWWHDKIVYEIYPKSFCDSDGDGVGDLGGIITKLDYLKDLGADILWICPCFQSPFVDQGYDISDYYRIDPVFSSNEQMDMILREAGARGMSVILDLVVNHCSVEHFWFQEACRDPEGKYAGYFTIVDAHDLMVYRREGDARLLVAGNWSDHDRTITVPEEYTKVLLNNLREPAQMEKGEIRLLPYQCLVLEAVAI